MVVDDQYNKQRGTRHHLKYPIKEVKKKNTPQTGCGLETLKIFYGI